MVHRISSSRLRAKLGSYLRAVKCGDEVVVTYRDLPVARLVPCQAAMTAFGDELEVAHAKDPEAPALAELVVRPIRYRGPLSTALLAKDRRRGWAR
jgi:prevent-host-death family protein